jgi:hypothetical protein
MRRQKSSLQSLRVGSVCDRNGREHQANRPCRVGSDTHERHDSLFNR